MWQLFCFDVVESTFQNNIFLLILLPTHKFKTNDKPIKNTVLELLTYKIRAWIQPLSSLA